MVAPRLVVGLGNPGPEYSDTRHNAGFWLAERLARIVDARFSREARFHGLVAHSKTQGLWLLLPQTYMNRCGIAVADLARFHRIPIAEILVLHDELDIPPGTLRLKFGGGAGGHNGLKDIIAHVGTQDFWRLRIGIGHPGNRDEVVNYVLKRPRAEEQSAIDSALDSALDAWDVIAKGDYPTAMQKLRTRVSLPSSDI